MIVSQWRDQDNEGFSDEHVIGVPSYRDEDYSLATESNVEQDYLASVAAGVADVARLADGEVSPSAVGYLSTPLDEAECLVRDGFPLVSGENVMKLDSIAVVDNGVDSTVEASEASGAHAQVQEVSQSGASVVPVQGMLQEDLALQTAEAFVEQSCAQSVKDSVMQSAVVSNLEMSRESETITVAETSEEVSTLADTFASGMVAEAALYGKAEIMNAPAPRWLNLTANQTIVVDWIVKAAVYVATTATVTVVLLWLLSDGAQAQEMGPRTVEASQAVSQTSTAPMDLNAMVDVSESNEDFATTVPEPGAMSEQEAQRQLILEREAGLIDPADFVYQPGEEDQASFSAAGCLPSGGVKVPDKPNTSAEVTIIGRGWGHGAGMAQYGALGAAKLGCDYKTILQTYFQKVAIEKQAMDGPVPVQIGTNTNIMTVTAKSGELPWQLCNKSGGNCQTVINQPQGSTFNVVRYDNENKWVISNTVPNVPPEQQILWTSTDGDVSNELVRVLLNLGNSGNRLASVKESAWHDGRVKILKWGYVDLHPRNIPGKHLGNITVTLPNVDTYLMGLGEISSSWPMEVQKVQAVTARTFLQNKRRVRGYWNKCNCEIRGTTSDQYYRGWEQEKWDNQSRGYWRKAIAQTNGEVMTINHKAINSFYNAVSGGVVEKARYVWGGDELPFSQILDDSRWERYSGSDRSRWSVSFSRDELGAKLGIGSFVSATYHTPMSVSGRIGRPGITFTGTTGSVKLQGESTRWKLGLKSAYYRINEPLPVIPNGLIQGPNGYRTSATSPVTPPPPVPQPKPIQPGKQQPLTRLSGPSRVETAIAMAQHGWQQSSVVVLANAGSWQTALAGVTLGTHNEAPLLLSGGQHLETAVRNELQRLHTSTVYVVGGANLISSAVENELAIMGITPVRVGGANNAAIAANLSARTHLTGKAVLVSESSWADSVAATGLANGINTPVTLFTTKNSIPAETFAALADLSVKEVTLVGGTAVISSTVEQQLRSKGYNVTRLSGSNRFLTSNAVAAASKKLNNPQRVLFASGATFPDSLAAGTLAGKIGATVVLVPDAAMANPGDTAVFLGAHQGQFAAGYVVGGTKAISPQVQQQITSIW